jgi:hypothetical protein
MKMLKQIDLKDSVGKTLKWVHLASLGGQSALVFTDGTFSILEPCIEFDLISIEEVPFDPDVFTDDTIVDLGIMSKEEVTTFREDTKKKYIEACEQSERRRYEELKKKFEGNSV